MTRAALLTAPGQLEIVEDVNVESPQHGEVLVRVEWCGVCHSDLHVLDAETPTDAAYGLLGHEASGIVDAVGSGVVGLAPGDRVVVSMSAPCGDCEACFVGSTSSCQRQYARGGVAADGSTRMSRQGIPVIRVLRVGGFAEYTVVQQESVVRIPDEMPLDLATVLACSGQTGFGAVTNIAEVQPGDSVVVFGLGGVGLSAIQAARIAGASVILGIEPLESRRVLAVKLGATVTRAPDAIAADLGTELAGSQRFRHAIDTVANAATLSAAAGLIGPRGKLVIVGVTPATRPFEGLFTADIVMNQKRILGCYLGGSIPRRDIPKIAELWKKGEFDLESMVTGRRPLTEIAAAFSDLRDGVGLRTAVRMRAEA